MSFKMSGAPMTVRRILRDVSRASVKLTLF